MTNPSTAVRQPGWSKPSRRLGGEIAFPAARLDDVAARRAALEETALHSELMAAQARLYAVLKERRALETAIAIGLYAADDPFIVAMEERADAIARTCLDIEAKIAARPTLKREALDYLPAFAFDTLPAHRAAPRRTHLTPLLRLGPRLGLLRCAPRARRAPRRRAVAAAKRATGDPDPEPEPGHRRGSHDELTADSKLCAIGGAS